MYIIAVPEICDVHYSEDTLFQFIDNLDNLSRFDSLKPMMIDHCTVQ